MKTQRFTVRSRDNGMKRQRDGVKRAGSRFHLIPWACISVSALLNRLPICCPIVEIARIAVMMIIPSITAYSTAVGPLSSLRNLMRDFMGSYQKKVS